MKQHSVGWFEANFLMWDLNNEQKGITTNNQTQKVVYLMAHFQQRSEIKLYWMNNQEPASCIYLPCVLWLE